MQDCCEIQVSEENVEPLGRAEWMSTVWSPLLLRERSQALRVPALHRRMLLFTVFAANLLFAQVLKHAFDIVFAFDEAIVATVLAGVRNV